MSAVSMSGKPGSGDTFGLAAENAFPRAYVDVTCYRDGSSQVETCPVICERELSIIANGTPLVNLLCSGSAVRELAYGFLYSEGVVRSLDDVLACTVDEQGLKASFYLAVPVRQSGHLTVSSGFGGKVLRSPLGTAGANFRPAYDADELRDHRAEVPGEGEDTCGCEASVVPGEGASGAEALEVSDAGCPAHPSIDEVFSAMAAMDAAAVEYHATRGMHCSALFRMGEMLGCYEDIGRHNTFDKLAGHCLLTGMPAAGALLTTTGRVSAEMCAKALRLGVAAVASCSGPTDEAVRLAREAGVMLVGYAGKPGRAVRYA